MATDVFEIYIRVEGGMVQGIYGDELPIQINFIVRDLDNINAGDEDPQPENYEPETAYY